jgi:hypothetical protein
MGDLRAELEKAYAAVLDALARKDREGFFAATQDAPPIPAEAWEENLDMLAVAYPSLEKTRFLIAHDFGGFAGYYLLEELDDPSFTTVAVYWFQRSGGTWKLGTGKFGASFPTDPNPAKNQERIAEEIQNNPGFRAPRGAHPPGSDLPHPMKPAIPPAVIQAEFIRVTMDRIPDPLWQYVLAVRKNPTRVRPKEGLVAPTDARPVEGLGVLYREDVQADFEIFGAKQRFEVDPVHWLEEWLRSNGLRPVSTLRWLMAGGFSGDIVAEWDAGDTQFAGRYVTFKAGSRLFVASCRSARENYPRIADDFFLALTQFRPAKEDPGPLSEPVISASGVQPVPWKLYLPASWTLAEADNEGPAGTIQAAARPPEGDDPIATAASTRFPGAPDAPPGSWDESTWHAQLSATLAPASRISGWDAAESLCVSTLRDAGLELEDRTFVEEPPLGPFESSKSLATAARLRGVPGADLRCRVAKAGLVWFVSAVVGVSREVNPHAWMRNVRAHDLVAQSAELALGEA